MKIFKCDRCGKTVEESVALDEEPCKSCAHCYGSSYTPLNDDNDNSDW